ncbi:MAG: RsmB/NOP family class I SAM-dependent RNA methyltransferase [Dongiaceae bacterium]
MTPGARLQASIELLAAIHGGTAPADRAVADYFRHRRYIGGGDRRDVLERVYAILRARARLDWWIARQGGEGTERERVIAALALLEGWSADRIAGSFDGGPYRPAPLTREERALARALAGKALADPAQPDWVRLEFPEWLETPMRKLYGKRFEAEMAALMVPAETDLRVNLLKADRDGAQAALKREGVEARPTPFSPLGLRIAGRPPLATLAAFKDGLVEVQDEGSQIVALLADARPGQRVVDFCAGAGGKTLALAAAMQNKGQIVACDTLKGRVDRAAIRLRRAGVHNVERRGLSSERDPWVKRHAGAYDRVLVDAPCSGSGTWRRNPDQKWRLQADAIAELADLQSRILESAARLVKPGGRLVYATCALLRDENEDRVTGFLEAHPDFAALPIGGLWRDTIGGEAPEAAAGARDGTSLRLTPAAQGSDGFFLAALERRAAA